MALYYVLLSGNNIELARVEVESLLNLLDEDIDIRWYGRLGLFVCLSNPLQLLLQRAALVRETGNVLTESVHPNVLLEGVTRTLIESIDMKKRSFSVDINDLQNVFKHGEKQQLAERIGEKIQVLTNSPVSLKNPEISFSVISTKDIVILGKAYKSAQRKMLGLRDPSKKPFFHPSMMNSILAHIMCNIAEIRQSDLVLDPFCGGGSILCEASLIGARVLGIDMNWKLLRGAKMNLQNQGTQSFSLIQGDSRHLPVRHCDCIVTDPPYGRTSSTRGAEAIKLVEAVLEYTISFEEHLILCICASQDMNLGEMFSQFGLSVDHCVKIPVHSGLTREVFKVRY